MDNTKVFYSMRETIEMVGVPASTLRYWEQHFAALNPRKDKHGNRYYHKEDIDFIKQIKYLRDEMHITRIDAIQRELKNNQRLRTDQRQHAYEILTKVKKELEQIKSYL